MSYTIRDKNDNPWAGKPLDGKSTFDGDKAGDAVRFADQKSAQAVVDGLMGDFIEREWETLSVRYEGSA